MIIILPSPTVPVSIWRKNRKSSASKAFLLNQDRMAATPNLTGKALIVHKNHRAGSGECEIHASTERALVLRKAAGELVVSRKISGPEKLVLLAGVSILNVIYCVPWPYSIFFIPYLGLC